MGNSINVTKQKNQFTHPWTINEIEFVTKNINLMSYGQMAKKIFRSPASIQSKVRYLSVSKKVDKHALNQFFFNKWSDSMAYVLGFIAADGNICKTGNAHMIQIACDDKDVIQKIKSALSSESPIHERKRMNSKVSYQIRFSDKRTYNYLLKLGITPKKSLTLQPPKNIPNKYLHHYIRGFFDGDGSVWESSRSKRKRLVSVFYSASSRMAKFIYQQVKRICSEFAGTINGIQTPNGDRLYYSIVLGHRDSLLLSNYLYKKATIFLERKYNIFNKHHAG